MNYHPIIAKLDSTASDYHALGMEAEKEICFRMAGRFQQKLLADSPYKTNRRFLNAQWAWALGHLGLLYQLIRWFKKTSPETQLVLEAKGAANIYFLQALAPLLIVLPELPPEAQEEAMRNAVYFACPDGTRALHDFYKMIERECKDMHLLKLSDEQNEEAEALLVQLGVKRPFVALQARYTDFDPTRNVKPEMIEDGLAPYLARGYSVVNTGLDKHFATSQFPSVCDLPDPYKASFLLSASCDQYVGSNSGAWVMAHAFNRPVDIMNDTLKLAWIYE